MVFGAICKKNAHSTKLSLSFFFLLLPLLPLSFAGRKNFRSRANGRTRRVAGPSEKRSGIFSKRQVVKVLSMQRVIWPAVVAGQARPLPPGRLRYTTAEEQKLFLLY